MIHCAAEMPTWPYCTVTGAGGVLAAARGGAGRRGRLGAAVPLAAGGTAAAGAPLPQPTSSSSTATSRRVMPGDAIDAPLANAAGRARRGRRDALIVRQDAVGPLEPHTALAQQRA